jgi:hypothetical protein
MAQAGLNDLFREVSGDIVGSILVGRNLSDCIDSPKISQNSVCACFSNDLVQSGQPIIRINQTSVPVFRATFSTATGPLESDRSLKSPKSKPILMVAVCSFCEAELAAKRIVET